MFRKKEWIAMLLAGGQGSRLGALTKNMAKPAVPFGGKYRIIDFTLSNCINSGIDTVGVLTQYQPLELSDYIGNGGPWDLNRMYGGVHILPPYQQIDGADWYKGTANAVYQNQAFIERYDPEYVIILSGDHIYQMDYKKMLIEHRKAQADCTIAVLDVPISEASRYGIMNTDQNGKIYEFEEKPKCPKSTLASMGVYIFNWQKLKKYLHADEKDKTSANDFGKNIIPKMLAAGENLYAYRFNGYWKDVGTIKSLWEANMDLLGDELKEGFSRSALRIYSRTPFLPPQYISKNAQLSESIVAEGCEVFGKIKTSILFAGVQVEEGAEITDSIIMPGCRIGKGSKINCCIMGDGCTIGQNVIIGEAKGKGEVAESDITVFASRIKIPSGLCVKKGKTVLRSRREQKSV
ncbi:MAG: glucose-1-phosphate adenylyltransferase [Oscillospiraceae bacterium]|nr:glucose-1-phosphate adenylyltransferase [Oscillospiraceae bacterium]